MTDKPISPDLRKLRNLVALEIWRMEPAGDTPLEDRRAVFTANREEYLGKAHRLIKRLEKNGINLTLSEPET